MAGTAEDTADGSFMGWLQVAHAASAPPDGSDVGQIIRWYRTREGLTQRDAAARLNTTQSRLSKLEKGTQALRDVTELRYLARKLGIPPERLGVLPDHSADARPFASHVSDRPGPIRDSQEHWRDVRCQLNAHRAVLGDLAAELYPAAQSVGARPLMASGERYDRYSRALRDLARPDCSIIASAIGCLTWNGPVPVEFWDSTTRATSTFLMWVKHWATSSHMATAFVLALRACEPGRWRAYNVGSGCSSTVHEVIATAETVTGRPVPRRHAAAAREPATLVADSTRIRSELGWRPEKSNLPEIISDAWTALNSD